MTRPWDQTVFVSCVEQVFDAGARVCTVGAFAAALGGPCAYIKLSGCAQLGASRRNVHVHARAVGSSV